MPEKSRGACASSADKIQRLKDLGADHVVNYKDTDFSKWAIEKYGKPQRRNYEGGVDVAINLAGDRHEVKFLEQTLDGWHKNIAVNLTGPFHICQQVIPLMMEKKYGRIINIAGVTPYIGGPPAKSMVKLGIVGLTRGLAREFAPYNITANCIGPGGVERLDLDPGEKNKPLRPGQTRMGRAEEIVSLMVYLASDNAGFITGQCYLANGGRYYQ